MRGAIVGWHTASMQKLAYSLSTIRDLGPIAGLTRGNNGGVLCDNSAYNAVNPRGTNNPSGFDCDLLNSSGELY